MKGNTRKVSKAASAPTLMKRARCMKANSNMTVCTAAVSTSQQMDTMVEGIRVSGTKIECMAPVFSKYQTVACTMVSISTIGGTEVVLSPGPMVVCTRASGS